MTSTKRNHAARTRGELDRNGVGHRLAPAIDARRHLNAQRGGAVGTGASHIGPRDPRYEYLTQSHD